MTGPVRYERPWNRPCPASDPPSVPQNAEHEPPKGTGTTRRIELSRARGWTKPVGAISVTRPHSKFANPYPVPRGTEPVTVTVDGIATTIYDRDDAITAYRAYLRRHPGLVDAARRELVGRDLACWCRPGEACHADVLLRVIAGEQP